MITFTCDYCETVYDVSKYVYQVDGEWIPWYSKSGSEPCKKCYRKSKKKEIEVLEQIKHEQSANG